MGFIHRYITFNPYAIYMQKGVKFTYYQGDTLPVLYNTDKIEDFRSMFEECINIISYPPFSNTSNIQNFSYAFKNNLLLEIIPSWLQTSSGEDFTATFLGCTKLKECILDTSSGILFENMFIFDDKLEKVSINTENATVIKNIFNGCSSLKDAGTLYFTKIADATYSFLFCTALENIKITGIISVALNLMYSSLLKDTSILSICQALKNGISGTPTVTFNTALEAKATYSVKLDSGVLVFCDSADPDALGNLQQYVTAKGWILAFTYVPL